MKCPVCTYNSWRYLFDAKDRMFGVPGVFRELECGQCGLRRIEKFPPNLAIYYPSQQYYSYQTSDQLSFLGRLRRFFIQHELFWFVPAMPSRGKRGKLLDVGCGTGETLGLLKNIGWDVYGLEISRQAVSFAHQNGLPQVSLGSAEVMKKYPDNYFDVIRFYHVIEHLPDPSKVIKIAARKLKSGGELIVGTPNTASMLAKVARQYWYNLDRPRHLYLFSPQNISRLTVAAGLNNQRVTYASAGGWVGSIQYFLQQLTSVRKDLVNIPLLVFIVYPWEWVLDRLGLGDVFVIRARK